MVLIVALDLFFDRRLGTVVHFLNEFIVEIEHSFFEAHGLNAVEEHTAGAVDVLAVDVVGVRLPVQAGKARGPAGALLDAGGDMRA